MYDLQGFTKACAAEHTLNRSWKYGIATLLSLVLKSEEKTKPPVTYAVSIHLTKHSQVSGDVWHRNFYISNHSAGVKTSFSLANGI